ncbi:MAG: ABC transporter substrate-binding protein [Candidatus Hodarchaeota archaeon]
MTAETTRPKKKVSIFKKKPFIVGGISGIIAIMGIVIGINLYFNISHPEVVLVFGTQYNPSFIDPLAAYAESDVNLIDQVAEGLFDYNYSSEFFEPIPNLAKNFSWNNNATELTCYLRENVLFHDGTKFDATAVKWNFERINRLINHTDFAASHLWLLPDGRTIINRTQVLDDYTIKFILNAPYVPFKALLSSWTSYILSPESTPADDFIDLLSGKLVGTGPFIYDIYEYPEKLSLSTNSNYWGVKPKIDKLIFFVVGTNPVRVEAMLSGEIHMLVDISFNETTLDSFRNNSEFTVQEGMLDAKFNFLIMNNKLINTTMRKAISFAFNYSYWLDLLQVVRAKSPLPEVILYYNITGLKTPYCNISIARQTLKDAGWPGTSSLTVNNNISTGNEWEKLVEDGIPLATYNFSYFPEAWWKALSGPLAENLKQIGVKIENANMSFGQWLDIMNEESGYHRNMLGLTYTGWIADFNDPSTFVNPYFTNKVPAVNCGQVNDTLTQQWMEEALGESNEISRENLYYKIQKRLIEDVFPHVWLWTSTRTDIYISNLRGWYSNPYKLVFKSVYFV